MQGGVRASVLWPGRGHVGTAMRRQSALLMKITYYAKALRVLLLLLDTADRAVGCSICCCSVNVLCECVEECTDWYIWDAIIVL